MLILQLWVLSMVLLSGCHGLPTDKGAASKPSPHNGNSNTVRTFATVRQSSVTVTTSATGTASAQDRQSDEPSQTMQHSKLFAEFVSFAMNGMSTLDVVTALQHGFLSDEPDGGVVGHITSSTGHLNAANDSSHQGSASKNSSSSSGSKHTNSTTSVNLSGTSVNNSTSATSSHLSNTGEHSAASNHSCTSSTNCEGSTSQTHGPSSLTDLINSNSSLQNLFVEMMSRGSSGFVVSFDHLNVTSKSSEVSTAQRRPLRMWGLLPHQMSGRTLYFMVDHYTTASYEAETKASAREQMDDFEQWKSETLSGGDKLGEGTIGALLGGGFG